MFRVRIEVEAKDNLRKHYQNLRSRNPGSAYPDQWYYGIRAAVRDLAASADQCGLAYEDRFFAETIRQRLFDSYKILFTISSWVRPPLRIGFKLLTLVSKSRQRQTCLHANLSTKQDEHTQPTGTC